MKKFSILIASALIALSVIGIMPNLSPAMAQVPGGQGTGPGGCTTNCADKGLFDIGTAFPTGVRQQSVRDLVHTIINWALYLAAIIAVLIIIYGGFLYITARGNDTQAAAGTKTLTRAIIGLVIIVLSYMIVQVVYNFLVGRT